ncbi:MAG: hypothetical protein NTV24_05375 [Candidatus Woesebacteria bacterium]|nr:hypothetical protein [Candidatus Woesebacteria bacterium]
MEICDVTFLNIGVCKLVGYPLLVIIGLNILVGIIYIFIEEVK